MKKAKVVDAAEKALIDSVKVGDIFKSTWGYDQTNVNFFQVISKTPNGSVRVREVKPAVVSESSSGPMAATYQYEISTDKLLPPTSHSVFIKNQEKGDMKRLGVSSFRGQFDEFSTYFKLSSFAWAYKCPPGKMEVYESWYA